MRASRLLCFVPSSDADAALSAGHRELLRGGWLVTLGPGLVAGTPLLAAVLERIGEHLERLCADLGARPVVLPASEGEALVNVLLHGGAAGATEPVMAWARGAGFREQAADGPALGRTQLYPRFDLAAVGPAEARLERLLRQSLQGTLRALGLSLVPTVPSAAEPPIEVELAATGRGDEPNEVVGRLALRPLGEGEQGRVHVVLVSVDLFALVGALANQHIDERGLAWPAAIAPFAVGIVPPSEDGAGLAAKLAGELQAAGVPTLHDDRPLSPAQKRLDAERWGLPLRVLCGPASAQGQLVVEARQGGPPTRVSVDDLLAHVLERLEPRPAARRRLRRATY